MSSVNQSVSAWRHSVEAVLLIGAALPDPAWQAPTECPGWSVKDVYAHLLGVERWMAEGRPPFKGGISDWTAGHVAAQRGTAPPVLLRELREVYELRLLQFERRQVDPGEPALLPNGRTGTVADLLRVRVLDVWVHEQDIRRAVGRPGNLTSPGAAIAGELFVAALPRIVARQAAPGSNLRLTTHGDLELDVAVVVNQTGRGALAAPSQAASCQIQLDWEAYARLSAGRGDRAEYDIRISGDRALAERVLASLAITP